MKWQCKACGKVLTNALVELTDVTKLNREDGQDFLPMGFYMQNDGSYSPRGLGWVLINKKDLLHCKNHPDSYRTAGCCGMDGGQGMNRICQCSYEVATEKSDCWMAHFIALNPERVCAMK